MVATYLPNHRDVYINFVHEPMTFDDPCNDAPYKKETYIATIANPEIFFPAALGKILQD